MKAPVARSGIASGTDTTALRLAEIRDGWVQFGALESPASERRCVERNVGIADVSARGKLVIQGRDIDDALDEVLGAAPDAPRSTRRLDGGWITKLNRYELYATVPVVRVDRVREALRAAFAARHAHVTCVTHAMDVVAVVGPRACDVMRKLCSLDLDERFFPDQHVEIGAVAKITAVVGRFDRGGVCAYELHVDRSLGLYLWQTLLDAAGEYGGGPVGLDVLP